MRYRRFLSVNTTSTPKLSVLLPAYNERVRLPPYLETIRLYLNGTFSGDYEVVVVDDGSDDGLAFELDLHRASWPELVLLGYPNNRGKGAALHTGLMAARGELVLIADADGATPIGEEAKLRAAIRGGASVAVGSRLLRLPGNFVFRSLQRQLPGRAFSWLTRAIFDLTVWDTQCGFKMFRREALPPLLDRCRECGYLFDLEILLWAERLGHRIVEVPVCWRDVPGSKVRLLHDGWAMFRGLLRLRRALGGTTLPPWSTPVATAPVVHRRECRDGSGPPSIQSQGR
jgi:dolichyl-phosphate beta-glucosyltransferase